MPRPIEAFIHLDALRHNLLRCRQAADSARVWAVVKANAYGHGIERVYEALNGSDGFALLDLDEAQRLRDLGWRGPILLLEGVFAARDLELCSRLGLWHSVHHEAQIDWLAGHKTLQPHTVFLKINTGMNRLGFAPERARAACARLQALPQVAEAGLMMHFATADEATAGWQQAWRCFQQATADLGGPRSVCNSAALLRQPEIAAQTDWVRPGIALYGSSPDAAEHSSAHWGLQPAMSLRSRIIAVQNLLPGQSVGYGASFTAERPMCIGIVACGYADGYPRTCPTGTPVLVNGIRTRTLGRVSMDMLAVDLSAPLAGTPLDAAPAAKAAQTPPGCPPGLGSEVTLWGQASCGAVLPIDEVAAAAGTLGYELMCALAQRVPVQVV
ncbi:MAG: alanine racemase [Brachymonas sp.]|nr:alanine racemase [Brachymonas sp.]